MCVCVCVCPPLTELKLKDVICNCIWRGKGGCRRYVEEGKRGIVVPSEVKENGSGTERLHFSTQGAELLRRARQPHRRVFIPDAAPSAVR
jgi:hypothetical protein